MTTASAIPATRGELEGDEALETLRRVGRRRLVIDAVVRFRAADGFSHARALAFGLTLTVLPALVALVGVAAALDQEDVRRVVEAVVADLAPGTAGDILTQALQQGSTSAARESGETALTAGGLAALVAGTTTMAQVERAANRIYGVERDRPFVRRYLTALALTLTAGAATLAAVVVLVAGSALRRTVGAPAAVDSAWALLRWPLGLALAVAAIALLFEYAPRRRQPEASWLAVGAATAAGLWLAATGVLAVYANAAGSFGATYGPIAGTVGVLLWALATATALLAGLALAAQLEAARAGVQAPRVAREENV